jgi:lipoprotein NlpI
MRFGLFGTTVLAGTMSLAAGADAQLSPQWRSCVQNQDVVQQIKSCTALIQSGGETTKNRALAYNSRGIAYYNEKDLDRAVADYSEAIRLDPKYAAAYNNRGVAYRDRGDFDGAIADFSDAILLAPNYAFAFGNRGVAYFQKKDLDRAIADFNDVILLDPKSVPAYRTRGLAYLYSGNLAGALADVSQASELDPRDPYSALWVDIVGRRNNVSSRLPQAISQIDMTAWPAPIILMFLGQMTSAAVLAAADDPDPSKKKGQVCGANFFSGEWALRHDNKGEAARLFQLAASDCPKDFIQWGAANQELKALGMAL